MSQELIGLNPDMKRLRDDGYEIEIRSGHLLIHSVPYVTAQKTVAKGTLVTDLSLTGSLTATPFSHIAYFIGEHPCDENGNVITQIKHEGAKILAPDLHANHSFSNKPSDGYQNYYDKMTRYIHIISQYARAIDPEATARTYKPIRSAPGESVFRYTDTASSRAGIMAISEKLASQKVAIIGLGGTGSYVLDLVAKTPVSEIHLYDGDLFQQHNAFRTPGAPSFEHLDQQQSKVAYLYSIYDKMRTGIHPHHENICTDNVNELSNVDFVFICIDKPSKKKLIIEFLQSSAIKFIDAGLDVIMIEENLQLIATCRVTTGTPSKADHITTRINTNRIDDDGLYGANIQIADLNALNATLAVIKWKKICGFYQDLEKEHHSTYTTNVNQLTSNEYLCEN